MPRRRTDTLHAGLAARLRDRRVPGPPTKYRAFSTQIAPTPAECGRPSGRTVATKNVRSSVGVWLARRSRGRLHGSSAWPSWSRLRVEIGSFVIPLCRTSRPRFDTGPEENPLRLEVTSHDHRSCRAGVGDVVQRVGVEQQQVGGHAGGDGAEAVVDAEEAGGA